MTSPITLASVTNPDGSVDLSRLADLVEVAEQMRVALDGLTLELTGMKARVPDQGAADRITTAWTSARAALSRASAFVASAATDEVTRPPAWPFEPSAEDLASDFNPDEGSA